MPGNNVNNPKVNNSIYKNFSGNPHIYEFANANNGNNASNPLSPDNNGNNLYKKANNVRNNTSLNNTNLNENANADEIDTAFSNIEDGKSSTLRALNAGDKKNAIIHFTNFKKSVKDYVHITKFINTKRVKTDREIIKNLYKTIAKGVLDYESRFSDNITDEFMKVDEKLKNYKPRNRNNNYKPMSNRRRKTRKNRK